MISDTSVSEVAGCCLSWAGHDARYAALSSALACHETPSQPPVDNPSPTKTWEVEFVLDNSVKNRR